MLISGMVLSHRVALLLTMFLHDSFCFILEGIAEEEEILKMICLLQYFRNAQIVKISVYEMTMES